MGGTNWKLILISSTWDSFSQFPFIVKKNDFQKLAALWLAGEAVNHVGIDGAKGAEGFSAFQRRSCFVFVFFSFVLMSYLVLEFSANLLQYLPAVFCICRNPTARYKVQLSIFRFRSPDLHFGAHHGVVPQSSNRAQRGGEYAAWQSLSHAGPRSRAEWGHRERSIFLPTPTIHKNYHSNPCHH